MEFRQTFHAALLAAAAAVVAAEAGGVVLQVDRIRQRYPWNGLVDVDYTVVFAEGEAPGVDDNLEVSLVDRSATPAVTNRAITFLQAPLPLSAGAHRITWDANADGMTNRVERAEMRIALVHYAEAYMVIDVSGGPTAETYPVDFLNGVPPGGFGVDEYKGDKIVLRRIHPGSYVAGSPGTEAGFVYLSEKQHRVALSKPFYVGIYEITQKQYVNVMGEPNPSEFQGDFRPVERVSYNMVRGGDWPKASEPDPDTFVGRLARKCKAKDDNGDYAAAVTGIDLPTEFQWECACRAGTTGAFNTTNAYNNASAAEQKTQFGRLGRYVDNQTDGRGGISLKHTVVGSYDPNQWGLYDMHGNVWEWCRDWHQDDAAALNQFVDPKGPDSGTERVKRGGSWGTAVEKCRSAYRNKDAPTYSQGNNSGFRLSRTLP
ncbi:MAG: formylglycine-generating enzyme family protein [Kiritimatiellae bacterium]|nr:formylglycine-generating enzyme family protein [Kiritimatiellia bacterium]